MKKLIRSQAMAEVRFQDVIDRLEENNLHFAKLNLQNGVSILISQRGGHILGPFLEQDRGALFWINDVFKDRERFTAFLASGDWNMGGDRVWIAPEIQYNIQDRRDSWGTYSLPSQVDPGTYKLTQNGTNQWRLSQDIALNAYNLATGQKTLHLARLIHPVPDPLRNIKHYQAIIADVIYAGYEQVICLSEDCRDDIASEAWSLVQLNPGGSLLIPAGPRAEYVDYYEPIDSDHLQVRANHLQLKITGDRRYKVGFKAAHLLGRLAYFHQLDNGYAYLIVRNFFNNPSSVYVEEPALLPDCFGQSVHVYNDDGGLGGFGELEVNAQTIGGNTARSTSTDQVILWIYAGPVRKIGEIATHLIGVEI